MSDMYYHGDTSNLSFIDGYASVEEIVCIEGREYPVKGFIRGIAGMSCTIIEDIKPSCTNIINLGNGIFIQTIKLTSDFGERKGEVWEESYLKKDVGLNLIKTLDNF